MAHAIKNGRSGTTVKVDENYRLHTFSTGRTEIEESVVESKAYNFNSGLITLTNASESGILYYKHNEETPLIISQIVVILGPSTGGSTSDTTRVRIYKNVTTGTLVSAETAAPINSNRDFGSANTLTSSLLYAGAQGATITDGTSHIESLVAPNSRAPITVSEILRKGNSIAISYEPNDSNTSMKCMAAIVANLKISTDES